MKKFFLFLITASLSSYLYGSDLSPDFTNVGYLPAIIKAATFESEILDNITDPGDRKRVLEYYYADAVKSYYYLKNYRKKDELLKIYDLIYSYKATHGILALEKAKVIHENEYPVFSQKGGMLRPGDNSFYFRTDDEWTGFSTVFLGYRYGVAEYFNIALEAGVGLPQVYIVSVLLHFKIYETPNRLFFMGLRARLGYKFQNAESLMNSYAKDGTNLGYLGLGKDYLTITNRHSIYFAADLTAAFRLGRLKNQAVYYTIFPKLDFDLQGGQTYFLFCPVMIGYEVRFGTKFEWSFAVEGGYTFPLPWGAVPDGKWVNFPSLANVSVNYRFGDKFYYKENRQRIMEKAKEE
jgi:hypothetical protein